MSPETTALVRIAAALGADAGFAGESIADAVTAARDAAGPVAIREVLLQSVLFVGYPKVLNAFIAWRSVSEAAGSASHEESVPGDALAAWEQRGRDVLATVYGDQHEQVVANVQALDADLARWMVVDGYGKVLGRPGLPLGVRELCIVAILARQDVPRQLYSHLRGALNAGVPVHDIEETLAIANSGMTATRSARAIEVWRTVRNRRGE